MEKETRAQKGVAREYRIGIAIGDDLAIVEEVKVGLDREG